MQDSQSWTPGKPFTRVVRRDGRAVREYVPAGPAADYLHARADLTRLERDGIAQAFRELVAALESAATATAAYGAGVADLLAAFMRAKGFHFARRRWRTYQMSVELFTRLDGTDPHAAGDVAAVTDLGRDARAEWLDLIAGGDADLRAAVTAELAARRAGWAGPADPPAVVLLADLMALTWLEQTFFSRETARAWAERIPDDQRALYADRAAAADRRLGGLRRDLLAARTAVVEWDLRLEKLAELRRRARQRKRASRPAGEG